MQSRGLVIHGVDIKQSSPITDLRGLGFSRLGRQSRVSGPRVDEKGIGFPATVRRLFEGPQ